MPKSMIIDLSPRHLKRYLSKPTVKPVLIATVLLEFSMIIVFSKQGQQYIPIASMDFTKLDRAGTNILTVLQHIGYWVVLAMGGVEIIKAALSKDLHAVGKIITLSVVLYASFFALPYFLKLVENIF